MLYLPNSNAVFLHIPKCAGTWVRRAIVSSGVEARGVGKEHGNAQEARELLGKDVRLFTLVRNPLSWYQSYWADRQLLGWGGDLPIGHDCRHDDFNEFVRRVCLQHPAYLENLYAQYQVSGVMWGHAEKAAETILECLTNLGEKPNKYELLSCPRENRCASLPVMQNRTRYDTEVIAMVLLSEKETFKQYNYTRLPTHPDENSLRPDKHL